MLLMLSKFREIRKVVSLKVATTKLNDKQFVSVAVESVDISLFH